MRFAHAPMRAATSLRSLPRCVRSNSGRGHRAASRRSPARGNIASLVAAWCAQYLLAGTPPKRFWQGSPSAFWQNPPKRYWRGSPSAFWSGPPSTFWPGPPIAFGWKRVVGQRFSLRQHVFPASWSPQDGVFSCSVRFWLSYSIFSEFCRRGGGVSGLGGLQMSVNQGASAVQSCIFAAINGLGACWSLFCRVMSAAKIGKNGANRPRAAFSPSRARPRGAPPPIAFGKKPQ